MWSVVMISSRAGRSANRPLSVCRLGAASAGAGVLAPRRTSSETASPSEIRCRRARVCAAINASARSAGVRPLAPCRSPAAQPPRPFSTGSSTKSPARFSAFARIASWISCFCSMLAFQMLM